MDATHESERIFEIELMGPVLPDIWFVQGRAYQDIGSGDTVAIEVLDTSDNRELVPFKVVTASTYGYLLKALDRGLTGGLTIVALATKADMARYDRQIYGAKFLIRYHS